MDISILGKEPILDKNAILTITPLAPLSMVAEMPGSYYKTLSKPSKKMLCGLFENVLGWHFDLETRKSIAKDIKKYRQKNKLQYESHIAGSTFMPLLMDFFQIDGEPQIEMTSFCNYDDLWSKAYRRSDSYRHMNGIRFMNFDTIQNYKNCFSEIEKSNGDKDKLRNEWFKNHIGEIPLFYSSPTIREYIHVNGSFLYSLRLSSELYSLLEMKIKENNIGYLGNNEGWIDLKIESL